MYSTPQNRVAEWSLSSGKSYADPFNEVTLDVLFTDPDGETLRVPAFWAGEQVWRVRYSSPKAGLHRWRSACSDPGNTDLDGREGSWKLPLARPPIFQDWVLVLNGS